VHTTVFADRIDLRQAFVNVLKNAIEAMDSGGHLKIRVLEGDSTVTVLFGDTGSGIDPEVLDRIYEIGFSTKDVGSGLGLAQVDRCVREHFGTLSIESEPGEGTAVRISLPVLTQGKRLLEMAPPPRALAAAPTGEKTD
jgi:signal transduction histidine kinase